MKFINLIEQRTRLAKIHITLLRKLREKTADLIEVMQENTK